MSKNPRAEENLKDNELTEQPVGSRSQDQEEAAPPNDKPGRLLSLAQKLKDLFEEQDEGLAQIIERVSSKQQTKSVGESEPGLIKSPPIPIPVKENQGRPRTASGASTTSDDRPDPRGRAWKEGDPLIHIFVDHSNIFHGLPYLPPYSTLLSPLITKATATATLTIDDPVAAEASSSTNAAHNKTQGSSTAGSSPVQHLSHSVPTTSPLGTIDLSGSGVEDASKQKNKGYSRRLWYAALVLVLERGRPITSRIVVGSRPANSSHWQWMPVQTMERFGYTPRVLTRVLNFGKQPKGKSGRSKDGQAKGISPSTSLESPTGRKAPTASSSLNPNYGIPGTPSNDHEQGVDELIQLKIYEAITESGDRPVAGSTIVLATGDGGQGFLRSIRTALRLGWKVDLYAWEDSLNRAWVQEFGENEMFRIIGMNQFESWLRE